MKPAAESIPSAEGASRWALRAALTAAVVAAYANAFAASFQFDDWDVIVRDPRVQSISAWWDAMPGIRPLLKLSYALNHASGLGRVGFHATNLAIHAVGALLVLELALALVPGRSGLVTARDGAHSSSASSASSTSSTWIAFVAALVFALHPVQTEAVTYASGRSTSLSSAFVLASLLVWVRGWERDRERGWGWGWRRIEDRQRNRDQDQDGDGDAVGNAGAGGAASTGSGFVGQAFSIGLMVVALAVKESAVVVPALIALWVASEPGLRAPGRAALRACAPHALALLIALGAVLALPAYRGLAETSFSTRSPIENLVAQTDGLAYLAGQLVRFDRLNADPALAARTRLDAGRAVGAAAIGILLLGALTRLRREPLAAFAVVWTFVWLAPTNSLVARLDLVNDRQLYGALLGPALLFAQAGEAAIRRLGAAGSRPRARALARGLARGLAGGLTVGLVACVAVGLGLATHRRNAVYRDELVFWQDVARKSPGNARAFNNLGFAQAERCALDAAEAAWRRALALDPELVRAAVNLRLLREGAGQAARCRAEVGGGAAGDAIGDGFGGALGGDAAEDRFSRPPRSPRRSRAGGDPP